MNKFVERIVNDDFLWDAITRALPAKRKNSGTHFINFNCPMCTSRGESADRRSRCGVKYNAPGVGVHCFNCHFDTKWQPGELLSQHMRDFLTMLGVPPMDVKRLNYRAMSYRKLLSSNDETLALVPQSFTPSFNACSLPPGSESFAKLADAGCMDDDFLDTVEYLYGRGDEVADATTYFWTPDTMHQMNRRVIIPFMFENKIVGWTARAIDPDIKNRYHNHSPANFLFNNHVMNIRGRRYLILVEGIFDALAIDGVGMGGSSLNPQQIAWIKSSGLEVILLPDRDKSGAHMIDTALFHGWRVAFPSLRDGHGFNNWWEPDVKDAAEATRRYGRLWTVMSIIQTATNNKIEIGVKRKLLF